MEESFAVFSFDSSYVVDLGLFGFFSFFGLVLYSLKFLEFFLTYKQQHNNNRTNNKSVSTP